MKKSGETSKNPARSTDKGRRKPLTVVCSKGVRQRFLRGMITHDLVQRGLEFDAAYAAAHAIRDRLAERDEVSTAEIRDLIRKHLEETLGADLPELLRQPLRPEAARFVLKEGEKQPFSRGLLARSISAAGVDLDRAYRLVGKLEQELQTDDVRVSPSEEIARRVGGLVERHEGPEAAQRYRMVRRIHRLPRPLVIYLGGASGIGKSTLSLELAPLLRIYRVTSTDTIRQMMRMVFSPEILPAIHISSFEAAPAIGHEPAERGSPHDPEFVDRLIGTFEEQAARVQVGIRAVVERAIAENMSILIEGVHLYPPLVPFPDLEGAVYQVPLMLATPDVEAHRSRFFVRARARGRLAERYLENFDSIRIVHDFLLQQAEDHDVPLLETSFGDPPVVRCLRLVTGMLRRKLPSLAEPAPAPRPTVPTLLLIVDGLADRSVRALGGRTPLQAAATPVLDRLAKEGQCGLADPVAPGVVADTAAGSLALFGQSPLSLKRGPVQALGTGIELSASDIALRGNLATVDGDNRVVDRRAGRIREDTVKLAKALDRLPLPGSYGEEVEVRVKASTEHRLAIVLRGEGLSSAIKGSDPGDGAAPGPPLTPRPVDPHDERAVETARILALFEQKARKVLRKHPVNRARRERGLPLANIVLTRGAGRIHRLIPLAEAGLPLRLTCISGDDTVLGLARWLGAAAVSDERMTANLDTDRRPDLKVEFLERLDRALGDLLKRREENLRVAVASDHATLSESGQHAADPVPVLIWGPGIKADKVATFDEQAAAAGKLERFPLQLLLGRLFDLS